MRSLFLFMFGAACAFSQPVSAGLKTGMPFTDFVDSASAGQVQLLRHPKRPIIGVTGEVRLPFGLAIEVDALYRNWAYSGTATGQTNIDIDYRGGTWEFPLLLKYRVGKHVVRPFIDGGVSFNRLSGLTQTIRNIATNQTLRTSSDTTLRGLVLGAGLDIKALFIHVQPEVRFTRWGARRYFPVGDYFDRNQSQAAFLLGISF
jgi:hypothetical protein